MLAPLSLIGPPGSYNDKTANDANLRQKWLKVEPMFAFGSQALLDAAEFHHPQETSSGV